MGEGSYFNFDLIIEPAGDKYRARVFDSPAGQASAEFELPFSELELENFVLRMGRPRAGVRRVDSSEMEAVKQCGERLFRAVFADDVYASFLRSRDTALEEEKGLRVRLRIDVPEFHDYPWEFLYNAHLNQFLALSKDTPVVRYLELPYPVQPLMVQPPLKILVMISSPEGFPQLNVEEEWRRLSNALAPLLRRGLVTLERLKTPTLSALQQHLRRGEYHIFHFVGHGKFSEHKQDGMLLLEDENGKGRPVSGQYLGTVLHDHRSLQLVVLNACEGARTSREDPYAGVAQTLVLQGIPAVIAMQFEIVETAAITFAQEFYGAVADGFPVDAAVSEARKAIFATGNDVEWGTPVLYMRTPQGVIFEIPEAQRVKHPLSDEPISYVDKELEQKLEQLYTEGLAAFWVEDWDKACDRFQKILADRPDHAAAADKLAEAKRQRNLASLYARASEAQSAENWLAAQKTLEELLKDSPEYKDASSTLKMVKKQKRLAELYAEAKQLHAAKKWQAVAKVFAQIKSIDPDYPDLENLLPTAEKELEIQKRQAELNALYSRAVHEMDAGHWAEAQGLLRQVQEKEPGFLETERLLSKIEAEIRQSEEEQKRQDQINTLYEQAHGLLRSKKWRQALDKVEEICKLDEQFEDPEKIAERAKVELAREEQEAERQNELAAMYAEAVRLVREEKYQDALDKWQEIRGIDSKYPDRQKVQKMARKSLTTLAKPVTGKRRLAIPKSLWIGLGGIVTVAVVVLGLILSGSNGEKTPSPGILAPTSTQTTSGYADPTMYDDFDNPSYDGLDNGSYNRSLWSIYAGSSDYIIYQYGGDLSIKVFDHADAGLDAKDFFYIDKPTFIEASMYLDPATTDVASHLYLYVYIQNHGGIICGIFSYENNQQDIKCWSDFYGKKVEANLGLDGITPAWHVIRFEIDPETMTFSYIIDGHKVGSFVPKDSIPEHIDDFAQANFHYKFAINNFGPSEAPHGYIDYVRMGAIEDDPKSMIYDNFDNTTFDDSYDSGLWQIAYDGGKIYQESGNLKFAVEQTGADWLYAGLIAKDYANYKITHPISFEAKMSLNTADSGGVFMQLESVNKNSRYAIYSCGIERGEDLHVKCTTSESEGVFEDIFYSEYVLASWHTFRFTVDPDKNEIHFFMDDKLIGSFTSNYPDNFSNTLYRLYLQSYVYKTGESTALVDYVRIDAIEDDPTLYDNFDNPKYDDAFDSSKWSYRVHDPDGKMYQENGALVFSQSGSEERWQFLQATKLDFYPVTSAYFESALKLDPGAKGGDVQLGFNSEYGTALCGLEANQAYCWCNSGGSELFREELAVQSSSWQFYRIEVVQPKAEFTFYINGHNIGSCTLSKPTGSIDSTAIFDVGGWMHSRNVKGYIDYIRIGPLE